MRSTEATRALGELRARGMLAHQIIQACNVLRADNPEMDLPAAVIALLDEEKRKDAAIRAAARDLLTACEDLVAAMIQTGKEHHREVAQAQVAIRKARGEQ